MVSRIERHVLFRDVWDAPLHEVANKMGMTAGGVAKLCDRLHVPRPNRNFWRLSAIERLNVRPTTLAPIEGNGPIGGTGPAKSVRKRLPIEERRTQMLDIAGRLCLGEGIDEVTLDRVVLQGRAPLGRMALLGRPLDAVGWKREISQSCIAARAISS
jgi:hypothetical protein